MISFKGVVELKNGRKVELDVKVEHNKDLPYAVLASIIKDLMKESNSLTDARREASLLLNYDESTIRRALNKG